MKKNLKKIIVIGSAGLSALLLIVVLAVCLTTCRPRLDAPMGLWVKDDAALSWTAVEGASGYTVNADGKDYAAPSNEFDLSVLLQFKTYQIKVKALGDGKNYSDSPWSQVLDYTVATKGLLFKLIEGGAAYEASAGASTALAGAAAIYLPAERNGLPVTRIADNAFYDNHADNGFVRTDSITNIVIPDCVTSIGRDAFRDSGIWNAAENDGVIYAGKWAAGFKGEPKGTLSFKADTVGISDYAFANSVSVTLIAFPAGLKHLGSSAFSGCEKLANTGSLPSGVTDIPKSLFQKCIALTAADIPDGVISIGSSAFRECEALINITIPKSVSSIGSDAFTGSGVRTAAADNGVVYADKWAIGYEGGLGVLQLREDTAGIADYAFFRASLTSFSAPPALKYIGNTAFAGCDMLTSVSLPSGLISIGEFAFNGCTALTSVSLSEGLISIGEFAFRECTALTSIILPESLTSLGGYMLSGCNNLTVYARAAAARDGWHTDWNIGGLPVVWGYKG